MKKPVTHPADSSLEYSILNPAVEMTFQQAVENNSYRWKFSRYGLLILLLF